MTTENQIQEQEKEIVAHLNNELNVTLTKRTKIKHPETGEITTVDMNALDLLVRDMKEHGHLKEKTKKLISNPKAFFSNNRKVSEDGIRFDELAFHRYAELNLGTSAHGISTTDSGGYTKESFSTRSAIVEIVYSDDYSQTMNIKKLVSCIVETLGQMNTIPFYTKFLFDAHNDETFLTVKLNNVFNSTVAKDNHLVVRKYRNINSLINENSRGDIRELFRKIIDDLMVEVYYLIKESQNRDLDVRNAIEAYCHDEVPYTDLYSPYVLVPVATNPFYHDAVQLVKVHHCGYVDVIDYNRNEAKYYALALSLLDYHSGISDVRFDNETINKHVQ